MSAAAGAPLAIIREALRVLGIRRLMLGIHDPAFPCLAEEDIGRGSPYCEGARKFLAFVRAQGFTGVQLGPQGMTSPSNPSPYDGALFSRNPLSLAPLPLTGEAWGTLLRRQTMGQLVDECPLDARMRVASGYADSACNRIAEEAWSRFQAREATGKATDLSLEFAQFRKKNGGWLARDGLYEALRHQYGGRNWRDWQGKDAAIDRELWFPAPGDARKSAARRRALIAGHRNALARYAFVQFLLERQHQDLRRYARRLELELFGDLQIGFSGRDAWFAHSLLLPGYVLGAPPSRTNPEGQPWNYPVLDPDRYFSGTGGGGGPGPAIRFFRHRVHRMFGDFDGLRIDHPHGLVCPWVYRAGTNDPAAAVRAGARLFAAPDLPDHPELARYAIPRTDQLDRRLPRHADGWVRELTTEQVERYGLLFDLIVEAARENGKDEQAIACEILSTQPYPIRRVMERHGLGRFRVIQKADLDNPADGYRSENARPEDWIMLGNHDTPPIRLLAEQWCASGAARQQAAYLAWRLYPEAEGRERWIDGLATDPGELIQAKAADLFAGPAANVMIYFTDLLGMTRPYNRPGTVSDDNWSLRITSDFARAYRARLTDNRAINIPRALALALRAKGRMERHGRLVAQLERLAAHPELILAAG